jgi:hypothetical protein
LNPKTFNVQSSPCHLQEGGWSVNRSGSASGPPQAAVWFSQRSSLAGPEIMQMNTAFALFLNKPVKLSAPADTGITIALSRNLDIRTLPTKSHQRQSGRPAAVHQIDMHPLICPRTHDIPATPRRDGIARMCPQFHRPQSDCLPGRFFLLNCHTHFP